MTGEFVLLLVEFVFGIMTLEKIIDQKYARATGGRNHMFI
jgi:hypothetical protein